MLKRPFHVYSSFQILRWFRYHHNPGHNFSKISSHQRPNQLVRWFRYLKSKVIVAMALLIVQESIKVSTTTASHVEFSQSHQNRRMCPMLRNLALPIDYMAWVTLSGHQPIPLAFHKLDRLGIHKGSREVEALHLGKCILKVCFRISSSCNYN